MNSRSQTPDLHQNQHQHHHTRQQQLQQQQQHPHPHPPVAISNTGHAQYDANTTSHNAAALRGASLAFQKKKNTRPPLNPNPNNPATPAPRNNAAENGALLAATSASRDHSLSRSPSAAVVLTPNATGNSLLAAEQSFAQHRLLTPTKPSPAAGTDARSPSFIAATLAASRSVSPNPRTDAAATRNAAAYQATTPSRTGGKEVGGGGGNVSSASSVTDLDLATDTTSIPPTDALISLFEQRRETAGDPVKKDSPVRGNVGVAKPKGKGKPALRPMTPPRAVSPTVTLDTSPPRLAGPLGGVSRSSTVPHPAPPVRGNTGTEGKSPRGAKTFLRNSRDRAPTPPPTRRKIESSKPPDSPVSISRITSKPLAASPPPKSISDASPTAVLSPTAPNRVAKARPVTPPPKTISRASTVVLSPQPRRTPSQKIVRDALRLEQEPSSSPSPPLLPSKPRERSSATVTKPTTKPSVQSVPQPRDTSMLIRRSSSSMSNDTFVSASSAPSPGSDSPRRAQRLPTPEMMARPPRPLSVQNTRSPLPPRPILPPRTSTSTLPLESLTNAIMAGSLASARATPSRTNTAPTPPPPRRQKQATHMRQTLRTAKSKSEDEKDSDARPQHKRGKTSHFSEKLRSKKHHAHREGERKRWREEITARERKRYEGVWASNRGLLLSNDHFHPNRRGGKAEDTSQLVSNIVVRDIWSRSRLPFDELEEVWDLVDGSGRGALDKAEFVVGMWLVDQRLRGRKIPQKVSDSVWGSARGVRVQGPKGKGTRG